MLVPKNRVVVLKPKRIFPSDNKVTIPTVTNSILKPATSSVVEVPKTVLINEKAKVMIDDFRVPTKIATILKRDSTPIIILSNRYEALNRAEADVIGSELANQLNKNSESRSELLIKKRPIDQDNTIETEKKRRVGGRRHNPPE